MKSLKFIYLLILFACDSPSIENSIALTKENWLIEQQEGGSVFFTKKQIEIIDAKGCTVWYKNNLQAPIQIDFVVEVIDKGGPYDRVSDLNCFWMANDPSSPNDFFKNSLNRNGKFNNYHSLTQYYVGFGGHNNTKTRFRRYNGEQNRPLLPEHDLNGELYEITANKNIHISISIHNNKTVYKKDGKIIFNYFDTDPYTSGYFGFRTVNNHMIVKSFKTTVL